MFFTVFYISFSGKNFRIFVTVMPSKFHFLLKFSTRVLWKYFFSCGLFLPWFHILEINSISVIVYLYSWNDIHRLKLWSINLELRFLWKRKKNKKQKTTASNFQTMAMNSFVIPHDLMRGQRGTYVYMQTLTIRSFMIAELWNSYLRNIYTQNGINIQYSIIKWH